MLRELLAKFRIIGDTEGADKANNALEGIKRRLDAIIGFEAIKGLSELAEKFARLGEEIKVSAESFGIGVERFQALGVAAQQSSVSQEQLSTSMSRLSRALFEAKTGSLEAQEVFAHLGVPPGQIQGIHSADQALLMLSARLQTMNDPIAKLALTQKTLGRGSMEMVAFLSQGPGAIQAKMQAATKDGLVLSESQVNGLEKMNHAFEKLEAKLKVIMSSIVEPLAPIVERLVNDFVDLFNTNQKWLTLDFEKVFYTLVWGLGFIDGLVLGLAKRITAAFPNGIFSAIAGAVENFDLADKMAALSAVIAAIAPIIMDTVIPAVIAFATTILTEFAPVLAIIQTIHDGFELMFGEGNLSERIKKTWASKEIGFLANKADQVFGTTLGDQQSQGMSNLDVVGANRGAGAAAAGIVTSHSNQQNTFNIYGGDPHANAHAISQKIDEQNRRAALRGVRGNKVGSAPGT